MNQNKLEKVSSEEIKEKILQTRKEIFDLKIKQTTQQNIKAHILKKKKHLLAQLLTLQTKLSRISLN